MASFTWILLFCMLLSAVPFSKGIDFIITRTPGSDDCANVDCSHDANEQSEGNSAIRRIALYDVTSRENKFLLAYCGVGENNLFVDPTKVLDINGTAGLTKFHADLHLNFHNPSDCEYHTYLCEVDYTDASGKKQVLRKTIAPDTPVVDDDCSCSSITYRLGKLTNRANGATRQNYGLTLNLDNLEVDLDNIKNDTTELSEDIAQLKESHESIQTAVLGIREVLREIDTDMNELRNKDSVLGAAIDERRIADQDIKDNIARRKGHDKNTDKRLNELARNIRAHSDDVDSLQRADGVLADEFDNLEGSDKDLKVLVNGLKNESSYLRNQISLLGENDGRLRADIIAFSSGDVEIQGAITELNTKDTGIDRSLAQLNRNSLDLQEKAAQLKHATDAKEEEINELSQRISGLEGEITTLEQSQQSIDDIVVGLQNQDKEMERDFDRLLKTDVNLKKAIDALRTTSETHQQSIINVKRNLTFYGLSIADIRVNGAGINELINAANRNNSALRGGLTLVRSQQKDMRDIIDGLFNQMMVIESQINVSRITTVSKTSSSLILSSCTRGMPHDKDRAAVVLFDSIFTLCDTETDGGGWTVLERRTAGDLDFKRTWAEYKKGFGNPGSTDFYIGNDDISYLTSQGPVELRIDLVDSKGRESYARYGTFSVDNESSYYKLQVSDYQGTAGDSLGYHNGAQFSTYDQDHDSSRNNCADFSGGGWWYKDCSGSNLNGVWGADGNKGVLWKTASKDTSVRFVEIKIRYLN